MLLFKQNDYQNILIRRDVMSSFISLSTSWTQFKFATIKNRRGRRASLIQLNNMRYSYRI